MGIDQQGKDASTVFKKEKKENAVDAVYRLRLADFRHDLDAFVFNRDASNPIIWWHVVFLPLLELQNLQEGCTHASSLYHYNSFNDLVRWRNFDIQI